MNILMAGFIDHSATNKHDKFKVGHTLNSGIYEITINEELKKNPVVVATSSGENGLVAAVSDFSTEKVEIRTQRWENGNLTFRDCSFFIVIIEGEH